jgi:hypothetical protein
MSLVIIEVDTRHHQKVIVVHEQADDFRNTLISILVLSPHLQPRLASPDLHQTFVGVSLDYALKI